MRTAPRRIGLHPECVTSDCGPPEEGQVSQAQSPEIQDSNTGHYQTGALRDLALSAAFISGRVRAQAARLLDEVAANSRGSKWRVALQAGGRFTRGGIHETPTSIRRNNHAICGHSCGVWRYRRNPQSHYAYHFPFILLRNAGHALNPRHHAL